MLSVYFVFLEAVVQENEGVRGGRESRREHERVIKLGGW
jgi:hypothetical protein